MKKSKQKRAFVECVTIVFLVRKHSQTHKKTLTHDTHYTVYSTHYSTRIDEHMQVINDQP